VSGDGLVVVGLGYIKTPTAFRWTASAGMINIGSGDALDVNYDGSVVVGWSFFTANNGRAARWTPSGGMKDLNVLLTNAGVNMKGITLGQATAVSGNGQFIVADTYLVRYVEPNRPGRGPIAALTKLEDVRNSVKNLCASRLASLIEQQSFAEHRGDRDRRVSHLTEQLSLSSAVHFTDEGRTDAARAAQASLALHYEPEHRDDIAPFAEIGGWTAPNEGMRFERHYTNGAGTSTGQGFTDGRIAKSFARAGISWQPGPRDQLALSAEIAQSWSIWNGYVEPFSAANPFEANVAAATDMMSAGKLRLEWTEEVSPRSHFGLWAAAGRSFAGTADLNAAVPGLGTLTAAGFSAMTWVEVGGRASFQIMPNAFADVAGGVVTDPLGTAADVRATLRFMF
jgi:probable HAF family extracellular repeat protein